MYVRNAFELVLALAACFSCCSKSYMFFRRQIMAHCFELPLKPNNLTTSMLLQKFVSDVSVTRECDMCDFHTGGYIL